MNAGSSPRRSAGRPRPSLSCSAATGTEPGERRSRSAGDRCSERGLAVGLRPRHLPNRRLRRRDARALRPCAAYCGYQRTRSTCSGRFMPHLPALRAFSLTASGPPTTSSSGGRAPRAREAVHRGPSATGSSTSTPGSPAPRPMRTEPWPPGSAGRLPTLRTELEGPCLIRRPSEGRPRRVGRPRPCHYERADEAALGSAGDGRGRSRWRIAGALIAASAAAAPRSPSGTSSRRAERRATRPKPPDPGSSRPRAGSTFQTGATSPPQAPSATRRTSPSAPTSSRARSLGDDRPVGDGRRPPPGDLPPDRRERGRRRPVPPPELPLSFADARPELSWRVSRPTSRRSASSPAWATGTSTSSSSSAARPRPMRARPRRNSSPVWSFPSKAPGLGLVAGVTSRGSWDLS